MVLEKSSADSEQLIFPTHCIFEYDEMVLEKSFPDSEQLIFSTHFIFEYD